MMVQGNGHLYKGGNSDKIFCAFLVNWGLLQRKEFAPEENILSFLSRSYFQRSLVYGKANRSQILCPSGKRAENLPRISLPFKMHLLISKLKHEELCFIQSSAEDITILSFIAMFLSGAS